MSRFHSFVLKTSRVEILALNRTIRFKREFEHKFNFNKYFFVKLQFFQAHLWIYLTSRYPAPWTAFLLLFPADNSALTLLSGLYGLINSNFLQLTSNPSQRTSSAKFEIDCEDWRDVGIFEAFWFRLFLKRCLWSYRRRESIQEVRLSWAGSSNIEWKYWKCNRARRSVLRTFLTVLFYRFCRLMCWESTKRK